jgi:AcrR family transcriptional regulator
MRTAYHHGDLRHALLAEAERRLAGGAELSLRELARSVGVSHAAPRRHFADKRALLDALALNGFARLGAALEGAIAGAAPAVEARLTALARAYVAFATEHAALLELMFAGKHRDDALAEAASVAFAGPVALIADAQAAGELVPGEHVAPAAWATIHGVASLATAGMVDAAALDALIPAAIEHLVLGLRPR